MHTPSPGHITLGQRLASLLARDVARVDRLVDRAFAVALGVAGALVLLHACTGGA